MAKSKSHMQFYNSMSRLLIILAIPFMLLVGSCSTDEGIPDVSGINISLRTYRFDKDLYDIDTNHIADGLQKLAATYPDFLNYYLDTFMAFEIRGNYSDTVKGIREDLRQLLTFKDYVELQDTIEKHYPDNKDADKELIKGFRFLKYYFPAATVPKIIYVNMGLSKWQAFALDTNTLCIGLDMFLGDQYPHYKSVGVPGYMLNRRKKNYMPVSVFSTIYRSLHPFNTDDKTLLDLMIQRGKEQYFLRKVLPHLPDSVLFGFTPLQMDWCRKNELLIYNFFIQQNLLYNKSGHHIIPYITDGPFARGLESPDEPVKKTPGNIGSWLGYKIVSAYMVQYPQTSLQDLVEQNTDPARFLDSARYRPAK